MCAKAAKARQTIDIGGAPAPLSEALKALSKTHPQLKSGSGMKVEFVKAGAPGFCRVSLKGGNAATIEYGSQAMALRGVGSLLAGLPSKGAALEESSAFETFGIMLDCSRNAVMTVEHFKGWLDKLALLGYNMAMLYTEDTYEMDGEPAFGFMRGAYTKAELKEIDAYASTLGMEMIPCIQTLGHLEQIFSWTAYDKVKDTSSVLMVDEPKTYELIEKMVSHWSSVFKSRRIHVGMDETHDLGRGRFYDLHGDERHFDIFNRHLAKVTDICKGKGLKPMIWSDMYFRMGSKTMHYYDTECVIPEDVAKSIPKESELVYWDYYHPDEEFYLDWIERHRKLGHEPLMGSGVWTWGKFWHDMNLTVKNGGACVKACRKANLKELFFTMWGDDGGYCDFDSAIPGLAYAAELSFKGDVDEASVEARVKSITGGGSFAASAIASELETGDLGGAKAFLWADPIILCPLYRAKAKDGAILRKEAARFNDIAKRLGKAKSASTEAGDIKLAKLLALLMAEKALLADSLLDAYSKKDKAALAAVRKSIPALIKRVKAFASAFRAMWLRHNKPFGIETMQVRFGGMVARLDELALRLDGILSGELKSIPELDANLSLKAPENMLRGLNYRLQASGSTIL